MAICRTKIVCPDGPFIEPSASLLDAAEDLKQDLTMIKNSSMQVVATATHHIQAISGEEVHDVIETIEGAGIRQVAVAGAIGA